MDYFFTGCMVFVVCCWIHDISLRMKRKKKEPQFKETEYGLLVKGN